jgi:mRNA interferase MazF
MISQFEIWWVNLDPTIGVETQKTRPCLVVSSNTLNQGQMIFVAPFLKGTQLRFYAVNVEPSNVNHLDIERRVDLRQMRSVDKARFKQKLGRLEEQYHAAVHKALDVLFH